MPRTTAQIKGDALEQAVQIIEACILGANSATENAAFTIEPKKIINAEGVKHEIDIYITIDYGKGYKSIFLFECKNWENKVGKDEIIVFAEKMKVTQATRGFFVAKSFTSDAEAQAKQNGKIELLIATEDIDGVLLAQIVDFSVSINTDVNSHTNFIWRPGGTPTPDAITDESFALYNNEPILLRTLNERIRQRIINETMRSIPAHTLVDDACSYTRTQTLVFQPQELIIEGCEFYRADMTVTWKTRIIRPPIVSKFDIKTRGRVITYDTGEIPSIGGSIQMSFVEIE